MPFFATMPTTMIMPTNEDTLRAVPVAHIAPRLPVTASALGRTSATTAATDPNSTKRTPPTTASAAPSTRSNSLNARC
jgi:hypothetical protein